MKPRRVLSLFFALSMATLIGCQTAYYTVWEKLGKEKRHLLKDNVEQARAEQEDASQQFQDVLTRIKSMYGFSGGELEAVYDRVRDDYEGCIERAEAVKDRTEKVKRVGRDLFTEWDQEIGQIGSADLRKKSMASMRESRRRYDRLVDVMEKAQARMDPVLADLKDYVLYLKHHMNAASVGALRQEVTDIEADVSRLLNDIGRSIQEAESFLTTFGG